MYPYCQPRLPNTPPTGEVGRKASTREKPIDRSSQGRCSPPPPPPQAGEPCAVDPARPPQHVARPLRHPPQAAGRLLPSRSHRLTPRRLTAVVLLDGRSTIYEDPDLPRTKKTPCCRNEAHIQDRCDAGDSLSYLDCPSGNRDCSSKLYLLPIYLVVALGCYGLFMVGFGLMFFPTCPQEAVLLQQDIVEAKEFLSKKGVDVSSE
uniref:Uncharacterized protein n=1 Tax=Leersia perrieri TaxID=77586 RepID=A0A0D9XFK0_9ORYZ